MSDIAIRINNLSKRYRIGKRQTRPLNRRGAIGRIITSPFNYLLRTLQPPTDEETLWALRDVSFEVKHGEVVGLIGRNGAGKSTLLKILSQITDPSEGSVDIYGRVGSLLEVGTGFHPDLTGRENVYMNGTLLGMSREEISRKFDEIVDFAGVEKFIDTPVKYYSSGMHVRLGFAVAAHLDPEILVVDEVLAVGDAEFQKKCLGKMQGVAGEGRTILFVSHNMGSVNILCPKAVWIEQGRVSSIGVTSDIVQKYLATNFGNYASRQYVAKPDSKAYFTGVRLLDQEAVETVDFSGQHEPMVEIEYIVQERVIGCHVACIVSTGDGIHIFSTADTDLCPDLFGERLPGLYRTHLRLPTKLLNTGTYHISIGIGIPGIETLDRQDAISFHLQDTGDFGTMKEGARRTGLLLVEAAWELQKLE